MEDEQQQRMEWLVSRWRRGAPSIRARLPLDAVLKSFELHTHATSHHLKALFLYQNELFIYQAKPY